VTQWPVSNTSPQRAGKGGAASRPRVRRKRRSLLPQAIELAVILAFIVGAYYGALYLWDRTAPREVAVPKVTGLPTGDATSVLRTAGLQSEIIAERPDEKVPQGVVISSDPPPERLVKAGRLVRLVVSSGSRWAKVPEVGKMSVDRAKAVLSSARLSLGRQTPIYSESVPPGYVVDQNPKPGTRLTRNSEVAVRVSMGPKPVSTTHAEEPKAPNEQRATEVQIVVPPGASLQEVKIVVRDDKGTRTVYRGYHQPGEVLTRTVHGEGTEATVEVYDSGVLAETRKF
jgi:hypothetical protein